ncbi:MULTISPECIES: molybdopterin-guanine dinucleotide biosynthesis protein B [Ralstonia solanacearum species complex]|uniref:Molybdopterin-guanine dinucleotide biosynthesis protein B n=1 Tax=Ralstonia syzygii TaxID=28097 RepID=A0ABX7ZNI4_9RALS|nr:MULTISPECIES: molybdopterin-guanine dinucleotide biosynthesis protein B [Ralstonia solanacearum species complex]BEU74959.1 molybdopterin-guanine dinucleotide biosynthesis protein B [Ralstonia pseudosolanacearum]AXV79759.1 molybdopterin-guanine dinucleotide biosynthesis protein B [Ralstonia solanacearum]AXV93787.1 molybdopterin-guanine dinucleotide biosynthesis protein B [Ralstonia solanacearum]AXW21782.1 molybdopterin-guanine dinucleotide biosynthesis protein B [Ralstonia solanacearum]AXW78
MSAILGITGRSGSGKTTLIEAMLPLLRAQGLTVNVIKHSHHRLALEPPGKDSARVRAAGAAEVMVASPYHYALIRSLSELREPTLAELLARMSPADLTLVEGFRREAIPRLEVYRPSLGKSAMYPEDPTIVAVASDVPLRIDRPSLNLDRPQDVVAFLWEILGQIPNRTPDALVMA